MTDLAQSSRRARVSHRAATRGSARVRHRVPWAWLMLPIELVAVVLTMTAVVAALDAPVLGSAGYAVLVLLASYVFGAQAVRPGLPRPGKVLRDLAVPFGAAGAASAVGLISTDDLRSALCLSVAAGAVTAGGALLRHLLPVQQRVVVVGSAVDVAEAATRWAGDRRINVVGSLVLGAQQPVLPRQRGAEEVGISVVQEADDPRAALLRFAPDLVLVTPGGGLDADRLRRIGWALEGTGIALALQSQLEGIGPHRIEHTLFAGSPVVHLRSSRPAPVLLALKALVDRVVGSVLLVLASPLILALVVAVRATSAGSGIFQQVRVGRDGRRFTMYKLRTMTEDAEAVKAFLLDSDEGNGLLFKKRADPRVTPLGRVLRKYSLDELPQLINVVKGDMSLVGPRPALPSEVARYTAIERRRLVVRPGMTGAWQINGRSTLGRDESVRLDIDYADNYRLVDDVVIGLKTVDAVVRPKGAW
ncbi:sugar transferase [Nocardioides sp. 616]|uniref:sugar transferase n=1 Tax=Nocardioides sp. 616 TaxID=2268090 RepID=UPI000CE53C5D|nr:sugar transferase [Nocardioides sp. 616]